MQFLLPVSLLVAVAAAQSTLTAPSAPTSSSSSTDSSICAAQNVLDQCVTTNMGYVDACASTDYSCLCSKWNDVLTCYLQCPGDVAVSGARSNKAAFCQQASISGAPTSVAISRPVSSAPASSGAAGSTPAGASGAVQTPTGTGSSSSPSASSKNGAGKLAIGAGSVMMGLAGVVAAVL